MTKRHHDDLIAMLLGDATPSVALERWLASEEGRRELVAYRRTLDAVRRVYGEIPTVRSRRTAYYDTLETPIGRVLVAVTDAGLARIAFRGSEASFVRELRERLDADVTRSAAQTADVVRQLRAYFAGKRRAFDIALDLRALTPFQRRVLMATARVPAGLVVPYGEIARRIGKPAGSRAVGQALGHNPIPIVIPCHRVVASGGRLGGYTGGLHIKRTLLRLEGALAANG